MESGTNDKVLLAQSMKVPILDSRYVKDSLLNRGLLPIDKYQLWTAPNGEKPVRPKPSSPPPVQMAQPPKTTPIRVAPVATPTTAPVPAAPAPTPVEKKSLPKVPKKLPVLDLAGTTFRVARALHSTPAWEQREPVLSTIASRKVTLVTGPPGCGKSTVLPQLVLDMGLVPPEKQVTLHSLSPHIVPQYPCPAHPGWFPKTVFLLVLAPACACTAHKQKWIKDSEKLRCTF